MTTTIEKPPETTAEARYQFCLPECRLYHTLEAVRRYSPVCERECWLEAPYNEGEEDATTN